MILAASFNLWNPLAWEIVPRIHIGSLAISPHGIAMAAGYFIGTHYAARQARRLGGPDEADIWNGAFWGLIGALIGARFGYVAGHIWEVTDGGQDPLGIFKVWEGGISLLGGITGGVLAALPYIFGKQMGFWRTFDIVAPALALGIAIGRIGDLMIGDHLGKPTSFPLGWRCLGEVGGAPPRPGALYVQALENGDAPSLGCFDVAVHQTALYDLLSALALFGVLLWLGRRRPKYGLLTLTFPIWYGTVRVVTDFLRVDKRYFGLTGSQILALVVMSVCVYLLVRYRGQPLPTRVRFEEPAPVAVDREPVAVAAAKESAETGSPARGPEAHEADGDREEPGEARQADRDDGVEPGEARQAGAVSGLLRRLVNPVFRDRRGRISTALKLKRRGRGAQRDDR